MRSRPPLQFYVLATAIVAAPFLGLMIDPRLGLLSLAAALGAVIYVIIDARSQVGPEHRQRLLLIGAGLGLLLVATLSLFMVQVLS